MTEKEPNKDDSREIEIAIKTRNLLHAIFLELAKQNRLLLDEDDKQK